MQNFCAELRFSLAAHDSFTAAQTLKLFPKLFDVGLVLFEFRKGRLKGRRNLFGQRLTVGMSVRRVSCALWKLPAPSTSGAGTRVNYSKIIHSYVGSSGTGTQTIAPKTIDINLSLRVHYFKADAPVYPSKGQLTIQV
jgi:hypothetical protein